MKLLRLVELSLESEVVGYEIVVLLLIEPLAAEEPFVNDTS